MTTPASQTSSTGSSQSQTAQTTSAAIPSSDDLGLVDLDELIPKELRDAVNNPEKKTEKTVKTQAPEPNNDDDKSVDDDTSTDDGADDGASKEDDDDELDLSSDNIDKLIDGDNDAVNKKPVQDTKPHWHEDPTYKELTTKFKFSNITPEKIDKLILDAIDKKVLTDSEERNTLNIEVEQLKSSDALKSAEIDRLKNIERTAFFDRMPETNETYFKPMVQLETSMKAVLDMEGTSVSLQQILAAKNKAEFTETIKDIDFDDATLQKMTNYWRGYKELQFKYLEDKKTAQTNLRQHLSFNIPDDAANKLFSTSILDFSQADERYSYIKKAINEGLQGHEHVGKILHAAKSNFLQIIRAISNPVDYSKNVKFLDSIAKFTLDAAHSAHIEDQHKSLQEQNKILQTNLVKVVNAYRKLKGSAEGITGKKGPLVRTNKENGHDRASKKDLEEFQNLLSNKIGVADILPTFDDKD